MTIEKRILGKSGIKITKVGFGLWAAGGDAGSNNWGPTDDQEIINTIDKALEMGVTLFDTADVYGLGHSEILLGKAMKGRRERFIVASKIGWIGFDGDNNRTQYSTVEKLVAGVEENLSRLGTDYIDVLQNHIGFREPNMEIFIEGFQKLQQQGKVRAYGLSTSDLGYIKAFNADGNCAMLQIDYSILNRTPEAEIYPYCLANNIGILVRGPLAMGILTGKFSPETTFAEGEWRNRWLDDPDEHKQYLADLTSVNKLRSLANEDRTMAQLALQFVMAHPAVTSVIPGAKNSQQLASNTGAALLADLTTTEMATIDAIVPPSGGRKIWPA